MRSSTSRRLTGSGPHEVGLLSPKVHRCQAWEREAGRWEGNSHWTHRVLSLSVPLAGGQRDETTVQNQEKGSFGANENQSALQRNDGRPFISTARLTS